VIELYTWGTPNGQKASIMLEECGLPYNVHAIDISRGAQRDPAFLAINPNGKIPAIVDVQGSNRTTIFESGAILIYLAEKVGRFLPPSGSDRSDALAWTFWQVGGLGPMLGQWLHFQRAAPEPLPYAIDRYRRETERLVDVLNGRLTGREYLAGAYSIADIAVYPWAAAAQRFLSAELEPPTFANVNRWLGVVGARPAVAAGLSIPHPNSEKAG
jgi:GST-like protein